MGQAPMRHCGWPSCSSRSSDSRIDVHWQSVKCICRLCDSHVGDGLGWPVPSTQASGNALIVHANLLRLLSRTRFRDEFRLGDDPPDCPLDYRTAGDSAVLSDVGRKSPGRKISEGGDRCLLSLVACQGVGKPTIAQEIARQIGAMPVHHARCLA